MTNTTCKNPTCSAPARQTYCSRRCQVAMRTRTGGKSLPDIWLTQDDYRRIEAAAAAEGLTVHDWVQFELVTAAEIVGRP